MGELDFIKWIRRSTRCKKPVLVGIGDDCAVIDASRNQLQVITTDTILDGTHFDRLKCTARQIGRKSINCSISDIAAMGCKPAYALVSINFPTKIGGRFCKELFRGIKEVSDRYNTQIIGGDVVSGNCPLSINVTIIGTSPEPLKPIKRSGARPGDVIMVTGTLGGSILRKHLDFEPRLLEGMTLNKDFCIHSMIDISDGLLIDLNHILEESDIGAVIDEKQIPISLDAYKFSKLTGKAPIFHALSDGEDYELLFTVSKNEAKNILKSNPFSIPLTPIGYIQRRKGLFIKDITGKERPIKPAGYEHQI